MNDPAEAIDHLDPTAFPRRVLFVAGAGRSGTSTFTGIMSRLGLHVPQPEVTADGTNPKGFAEPQWVVDEHSRLLKEVAVKAADGRPIAFLKTARVATREPEIRKAAEWLEPHFSQARELVVKDPRIGWFLPLWKTVASRTNASQVFATMLRPPAEVIGSYQKYYNSGGAPEHLAAAWLNQQLHTELGTRDTEAESNGSGPGPSRRAFIRYADLLDDWTGPTMRVGEDLQLQNVLRASDAAIDDVHRFVDRSLRRVDTTLADLCLPPRLHNLVADTWAELDRMADPVGDSGAARQAMDQLRGAYIALYEEAEAITFSSQVAARREGLAEGQGRWLIDRIPSRVRAKAPPVMRRRVLKVIQGGRESG